MWKKVTLNILCIFLVSLLLSAIFWKWFGKDFNFHIGYLAIDFFYTLCGFFTIIALGIAIYQIAELKNRSQIQKDAVAQNEIANFKKLTIGSLGALKAELEVARDSISRSNNISKTTIDSSITSFYKIEQRLNMICAHEGTLTGEKLIDCSNLITLHGSILQSLNKIKSENAYKTFPKQNLISVIGELIKEATNCESKLKI